MRKVAEQVISNAKKHQACRATARGLTGAVKAQFLKVLSRQSSPNRKGNGGNYELAQVELDYNGRVVFRSLFVDDCAEPTAA
jgi:hypothetical protein